MASGYSDNLRRDADCIATRSMDQDLIRRIKYLEDGLTRPQIAVCVEPNRSSQTNI